MSHFPVSLHVLYFVFALAVVKTEYLDNILQLLWIFIFPLRVFIAVFFLNLFNMPGHNFENLSQSWHVLAEDSHHFKKKNFFLFLFF